MAPIRVGLIGLAATTDISFVGAWGVNAHLRSIQRLSDEYELVAVANSSVESAQKSIDFHKLPSTTVSKVIDTSIPAQYNNTFQAAYGRAEDIAADPNVELIVVSVSVSRHFELAKPAIEHKKDIFVEWPLATSPTQAEELTRLATANGVRTMVGLQGRSLVSLKHNRFRCCPLT